MKTSIILLVLAFLLAISGCSGCKKNQKDGYSKTSHISRDFGHSITLAWDAPTTNADGTSLTDLDGYKIYSRTSSGSYGTPIDVGNVTNYTVGGLSSGRWCFAVRAYDTLGNESDYSGEVCTNTSLDDSL